MKRVLNLHPPSASGTSTNVLAPSFLSFPLLSPPGLLFVPFSSLSSHRFQSADTFQHVEGSDDASALFLCV